MASKKRDWGTCSFVKADGTKCKGFALKGADRCFQHPHSSNEEGKKRKAEANRNGGRGKAGRGAKQQQQAMQAAYRFETIQHVIEEYQKVYGDMRAHTGVKGFVDARDGEAQANVLTQILKALGMKSLEEMAAKLRALEERQAQQAATRFVDNQTGQEIDSREPSQILSLPDLSDTEPQELFDHDDVDVDGSAPRAGTSAEFDAAYNGRQPDLVPDPGQPGDDVFAGGDEAGLVAGEPDDDPLFADDPPLQPPSGQRLFG
jgi:hypothetical protein